jgi:hypothetical protein
MTILPRPRVSRLAIHGRALKGGDRGAWTEAVRMEPRAPDLREGLLRRFKGGIAESSFEALLREHPDRIPYGKLPPARREWLVLNGYPDQGLAVKAPSVWGLLE